MWPFARIWIEKRVLDCWEFSGLGLFFILGLSIPHHNVMSYFSFWCFMTNHNSVQSALELEW